MIITWHYGFKIKVEIYHNTVVISSNKEGLLSLADHLALLAEELPGNHIHYDECNCLEEGSAEMIIERIP